MLASIKKWFQPPIFPEDEDKTRSALLLNVVLNTFLVALPVVIVGAILGGNFPRLEEIIVVVTICWMLIFATSRTLRAGQVTRAGIVTVAILYVAATLAVALIGTIRAPATAFYILIIVMSGLIISRRAILWMVCICTATVITLLLAEENGLLPPPTLTVTIAQGITFSVVFVVVGILLYLAVTRIDEALTRARMELSERQRTETRFRGLLESAPDAMVVVNSAGSILLTNSQLQNIFGYTREEVMGKPVEVLIPERFVDIHPAHRKKYVANQRVRPMGAGLNLYGRRKDGSEFPVEISLSPIESSEDDLIIAAIRDITERINAEREREKHVEELGRQNAELERFTYTVSHDLKSPVVTIKGFLGMLKKDMLENRQEHVQKDIERIADAAEKMGTLLTELLELSRIGRVVNEFSEVDLTELTREALETLAGRIDAQDIKILVSPDLPVVYGDRTRLREVLENLIDNAVKYMGDQPDPKVEIGMRTSGEEIVFFVKDNGIGIDLKYQTRIFGLFEKLNAASEGTGIGLALIKRIIEVHGGRIWVESEGVPGKGSTFCFAIPDGRNTK